MANLTIRMDARRQRKPQRLGRGLGEDRDGLTSMISWPIVHGKGTPANPRQGRGLPENREAIAARGRAKIEERGIPGGRSCQNRIDPPLR